MRSKLLSVILSICMVLTLTPAMAFAAGDIDVSPQAEAVTGSAIAMQTPDTTGYTVTEAKAVDGNLDVKITLDEDFTEKTVQFTVKTTTAGITDVSGTSGLTVSKEDPATVTSPAITVSCDGVTSENPKTVTGELTFTGTPNSETYKVTVTITKDAEPTPTTYAVSGKVSAGDTGLTDVSGIEVNLYAATDTSFATSLGSGTTNTAGAYTIDTEVADGSYVAVVAASAGKYAQSKANVIVNGEAVTNANITLVAETKEPDPELPPVVDTTGGAIDVDDSLTGAEKDAADEAVTAIEQGGGITVDNTTVLKNEIAEKSKEIADSVEATDADLTKLNKLPAFSGNATTLPELIPVVLPKININITGAKVDESNATTSITYDLEYVCQVVLTTDAYKNNAEVEVNAIPKGAPQPLKVTVPVEVTLPLPSVFATALGSSAWVIHDNKNVYPGTISGSNLIFTAKHGFSPFTVTAENPSAAQIGADDYYTTLQEAVNAVTNNGTIKLLKNCDEAVTVNEAKTFTIDKDGKEFTGSVSAGNGYRITPPTDLNAATLTYTVVTAGSSSGGGGGGGSSATTYTVTVPSSVDNGKITVSPRNASKGNTVTITATPDEGYKVGTITVKDKDGNEIEVKDAGDGKYTFVMPASKVEISATFVEDDGKEPTDPTDPTTPGAVTYSDVAETAWYYDAVNYVTTNGLMNGVGNDRFAPNSNLTRAMFAQILYNKEGKPAAGASTFSDVAAGQWYTDAISWAAANGVVNGIGNNMFGPNNNITREQLAVMLYRYAGSPAVSGSVTGFNDAGQISSYATTAMAWATTNGVMNGKGDGRLDPKGLATRAEVAQMMQNYFK